MHSLANQKIEGTQSTSQFQDSALTFYEFCKIDQYLQLQLYILCNVQLQTYILYCIVANVCIISQTKRLEAHGARSQFCNVLNMKIAEDTGGVANENYDAMIWYY